MSKIFTFNKDKTISRIKFRMKTKHVLNHPNHLNLKNLISFHSHHFRDSKTQPKREINQRNKEVQEEEGQIMSGNLIRDNLNITKKFHTFLQGDKSTYLI